MYKVGVIGYGKIGRLRARLSEAHPDLMVDSVCDVYELPESESLPYPYFRDYREVIARKPDIVFVCTSNDKLAEVTIDALNSGCHVFSEKPPGRNVAEIKAMMQAETDNPGLKLKFGFNHRYHDSVIQAHQLVKANRLGKLLAVRGLYGKSGAADYETQWRNDLKISGGGILLDQGIHMLDLMLLFCENFDEVQSMINTLHWNINVEDNAFALLRNRKNQVGMLVSSAIQWKHTFQLDVVLEEGYLSLRGILSNSMSYGRESLVMARKTFEEGKVGTPEEQVTYFDSDQSWQREIDEFVDCVKNDKPVQIGSSQDALRVLDLIYRIYEADQVWWKQNREEQNQ